jgi:hypothetical protein
MDQPKYMVEVTAEKNAIAGIILACGRFGGEKALRHLGPKPLGHAISRAEPQVASLALSVNSNREAFRIVCRQLLPDSIPQYPQPSARILVGTDWGGRTGHRNLGELRLRRTIFPARSGASRWGARSRHGHGCLGGFCRPRVSGLRIVAGVVGRRLVPCPIRAGGPQRRCPGRSLPPDDGVISDRTVRSVFQHRHTG